MATFNFGISNFGNFQFWQPSTLATLNSKNFQFWLFSFDMFEWDPRTTTWGFSVTRFDYSGA